MRPKIFKKCIQICDFVSYFVHLDYKTRYEKEPLPNRVANLIDNEFVGSVMATLLHPSCKKAGEWRKFGYFRDSLWDGLSM